MCQFVLSKGNLQIVNGKKLGEEKVWDEGGKTTTQWLFGLKHGVMEEHDNLYPEIIRYYWHYGELIHIVKFQYDENFHLEKHKYEDCISFCFYKDGIKHGLCGKPMVWDPCGIPQGKPIGSPDKYSFKLYLDGICQQEKTYNRDNFYDEWNRLTKLFFKCWDSNMLVDLDWYSYFFPVPIDSVLSIGEWRPKTAPEFPVPVQDAMRTLLLLAKAC